MKDEFLKAGEVLAELFSHLNLNEGETYVSFFTDWVNLVGVDLACHVRPIDIRRQSLIVEIDHPGWIQMFQMNRRKILERIQKKYPSLKVQSIRIQLKRDSPVPLSEASDNQDIRQGRQRN